MPVNSDKISFPGEYNLNKLLLVSYNGFTLDIRSNLLEITIHEDIYSNCISGKLIIAENVNLIRHVPLISNEILKISFTTPSRNNEINQTFFVYKIDNKIDLYEGNKVNIYTLFFTSMEFIASNQQKISKSFKSMTYSEMAHSIYTNYIAKKQEPKLYSSVQSLGKKQIVIPFMSPIDAINLLASKSLSEDARGASFLFYETFDAFYYAPINFSSLIFEPVEIYSEFRANMTSDGTSLKDIQKDFTRIEDYQFSTLSNTLKNITDGVFSSKLLAHDITYKSYRIKDYSYNPDYYQNHLINSSGIMPVSGDQFSGNHYSNYGYYATQSYGFDDIIDNDNDIVHPKRKSHLSHFDISQLEIDVAGDTNRRIGDIVQVNLFSGEPLAKGGDIYDKYLSGKYLVTRVTHILQKEQYKMKLKLERDSIPVQYPETKVVK